MRTARRSARACRRHPRRCRVGRATGRRWTCRGCSPPCPHPRDGARGNPIALQGPAATGAGGMALDRTRRCRKDAATSMHRSQARLLGRGCGAVAPPSVSSRVEKMFFYSVAHNSQIQSVIFNRRGERRYSRLAITFTALVVFAPFTNVLAQTLPPPNVPPSADDANELIAVFHVGGKTSQLGPVNDIFQVTNGYYAFETPQASYQGNLALPGYSGQKAPVFRVSMTNLDSQLQSQPTQGAGGQTELLYASTSYSSSTLNLVVPATGGVDKATVLSVRTSSGAATSSGTLDTMMGVFSGGAYMGLSGMAGTVTGSLVGGKTVNLSSAPSPNDVLYTSKTVTVTQNVQEVIDGTSCDPVTGACSSVQRGLRITGLRIVLTAAIVAGQTVSGEIDLPIATIWTQDPKQ